MRLVVFLPENQGRLEILNRRGVESFAFAPYFTGMKTITVAIPETVEAEEWEIKMMLAAMLYQQGKASGGEAAEVAGMTKRTFLEMLGKFGVSVFSDSVDDLQQDVYNAGGRNS